VRLATTETGEKERFVTNNPLLSFHAGDPLLFGPAGGYRLIDPERSCAELVSHMREQEAVVAVIDLGGRTWAGSPGDPNCPLRLAHRLLVPEDERTVLILVLDEPAPPTTPVPGTVDH
jgi:hypothetical protein